MLALLSVFWGCRGTTNAKNFVEDLDRDCCPKARPAAKISAVLSSIKKGTSRSGSQLLIRSDVKDNRIARGLKPASAQPEKLLHVSRAQIAVGPTTVAKLSSTRSPCT